MEGAPDPSVGHEGSAGDARCLLDHMPEPCDFVDKRSKKCTEYGEFDPDFTVKVTGNKGKDVKNSTEKDDDAFQELSAKYDQMEANHAHVQDSVGKLTDEMAKLMKMVATLTKVGPNPAASLADISNPRLGATAAPQHVPVVPHPLASKQQTQLTPSVNNTVQGGPGAPGLASGQIGDRVQNLISNNNSAQTSEASLPSYTGPTIPELRKDADLSALVRSEVQRLISSQLPALQKNVTITDQQQHQQVQASNQQQLAEFRAQQKQQMDQFAANQEQQFMALQQQLGVPVNKQTVTPPSRPAPYVPAQSDHPAYTALQGQGSNSNLAMDMETLMGLTVRSKQFRPFEFAARTQLFYAKNITERNCNFPCYVLGYLRHCLILMSGVVPSSENEVSSRLTNLMNICEIAANNSTLNDFDCSGWQMAKAYGDRVFHDVETGQKTWEELPVSIMADTFLHAKDTVAMKTRKKAQESSDIDPKTDRKKKKKVEDGKVKVCTTYNTFRTGDGCAFEFNSDSKCVFEHYCKKCFTKTGKKEPHKALNCDVVVDKSE